MQAKRIKWKELNWEAEQYNLVFLDESGVNIDMTRRYGRAIGKARVHCSAPLNAPMSQTVLASVRLNGQITYTMYLRTPLSKITSTGEIEQRFRLN